MDVAGAALARQSCLLWSLMRDGLRAVSMAMADAPGSASMAHAAGRTYPSFLKTLFITSCYLRVYMGQVTGTAPKRDGQGQISALSQQELGVLSSWSGYFEMPQMMFPRSDPLLPWMLVEGEGSSVCSPSDGM